jgi:hypothetical protein
VQHYWAGPLDSRLLPPLDLQLEILQAVSEPLCLILMMREPRGQNWVGRLVLGSLPPASLRAVPGPVPLLPRHYRTMGQMVRLELLGLD